MSNIMQYCCLHFIDIFIVKNIDFCVMFASVSRNAERQQHRPETEVELEAGTFDYHELESDVASQQGCYSPVSSVSDMEPSADQGRCSKYQLVD